MAEVVLDATIQLLIKKGVLTNAEIQQEIIEHASEEDHAENNHTQA